MNKPNLSMLILMLVVNPAAARTARANDGAAGLTGGTLVFKNLEGVSMDSEVLHIAENQVRVRYVFSNNTDRDITTLVAFPIELPDFEGDVNFDPKDKNPLRFTVQVDGKRQRFATDLAKAPESGQQTLRHYWKQRFKRRSRTAIEHSYRPIFETGVTYMTDLTADEWDSVFGERLLKNYCATKRQLAWVKRRKLEFKNLTYILKTAATWDGPIKHFELNIYKGTRPRVFLCTDLTLTAVKGTNSFRATAKNYSPTSNLHLAYVGQYAQ